MMQAALALLVKTAMTYTLLAGAPRQLRITGTLRLVVLATVPQPTQVICPSKEDSSTREETLNLKLWNFSCPSLGRHGFA